MLNGNPYEEFYDPITYDLECDSFNEDFPIIEQWAQQLGNPLLDLACGTGRMSIHLAKKGYQLTGVDLVPQMVLHGQKKAQHANVNIEFMVADARAFHLNKQFNFIFMLMNAFQFLPTRKDYEQLFACVKSHLTPEGLFLFETRNPCPSNLDKPRHIESRHYDLPDGSSLDVTDEQYYDPMTQIQHYQSKRIFQSADGTQRHQTLYTGLRYVYPQEMEALLYYNGFEAVECYGDWSGAKFTENSPAMIYVVKAR